MDRGEQYFKAVLFHCFYALDEMVFRWNESHRAAVFVILCSVCSCLGWDLCVCVCKCNLTELVSRVSLLSEHKQEQCKSKLSVISISTVFTRDLREQLE